MKYYYSQISYFKKKSYYLRARTTNIFKSFCRKPATVIKHKRKKTLASLRKNRKIMVPHNHSLEV